jgi:Predicted oxidoreductases (related to aryl-alcohol dehydrogenases)
MRYTKIKDAAANVSKIAFGGAAVYSFGNYDYYVSAFDQYAADGGNLIDTGLCYGGWTPDVPAAIEVKVPENLTGSWSEHGYSPSELMIGQWLKSQNRKDIVISTKGAHPAFGSMTKSRVRPEFIARDIECSLRNLDVDYIDVYFLHRDDYDMTYPVSKIIDELNRHVDKGEIMALGASNWTGARIEAANDYAEKHGLRGFSVNQILFSLAEISKEQIGDPTLVCMNEAEYDCAKKLGLTVMAYTSQARGFFSKYAHDIAAAGKSNFATPENIKRLERVAEMSKAKNLTPAEISVAYLTSLDVDTIPIVGFSSLAQLAESTAAGDITLSAAEVAYLAG